MGWFRPSAMDKLEAQMNIESADADLATYERLRRKGQGNPAKLAQQTAEAQERRARWVKIRNG